MKLYNYNKNGEFTGETEARLDPLETIKQGKEVYLHPARTTIKPPIPVLKNECAVFDGDWKTVEDHRGEVYYDENGYKFVISKTGDTVPIDGITEAPPDNMKDPEWENEQWVEKYVEPFPSDHLTKAEIEELRNATTIAALRTFIIKLIKQ